MTYICSKCGEAIPLDDFESGRAVYAGGISYCQKCVAAVLPMLKALEEEKKEEHVPRAQHRPPVRQSVDHFASHAYPEKKSSNTAFIVLCAGAGVLLMLGLVVALSESGNGGNGLPGVPAQPGNVPAPLPPMPAGHTAYDTGEPVELESFSLEEVDEIRKAYEKLVADIDSHDEEFERNIAKLKEFERGKMPAEWKGTVQGKLRAVEDAWVRSVDTQAGKLLARAKELEKEWKLQEALSHLESFPEKFAGVGTAQSRLDEAKEKIKKLTRRLKELDIVIQEADKLLREGRHHDVVSLLERRLKEQEIPPELRQRMSGIYAKATAEIDRRKAEEKKRLAQEQRKKEEAQRERERKYEETRASRPLHLADWTGALPSLTAQVKLAGAEHKKNSGKHHLVFPANKKGKLTLKFTLGMKPEVALLNVVYTAGQSGADAQSAGISVQVDGKLMFMTLTKSKSPGHEESQEFNLSGSLKTGRNVLTMEVAPAGKPLLLTKVELRVHLPQEQMKKERSRARATMRRLLALAKKEERKRNKNGNGKRNDKKKHIPWPPAVKIGKTVSLFNGKDLSCWKTVGQGNWMVKNGMIVGVNSSGQPARLLTDLPGQNIWRDYEIELEVILVRGKLYIGVHGSVNDAGSMGGAELGPSLEKNKLTRVKLRIAGTKMFIKVDDRAEAMANGDSTYPVGAPYIVAEPNSEVRVKSIKFTLKSK